MRTQSTGKNRFRFLTLTVALTVLFAALLPSAVGAEEAAVVEEASSETESAAASGISDSDTLLQEYLNRQAGISGTSSSSSARFGVRRVLRKNRLTGMSLSIYNNLKTQVQEIADGTRNSADLAVPASEAMGEDPYFTAEDLGVTALTEVKDGKLKVTDEAKEAMKNRFTAQYGTVDGKTIVTALLTDCPYELYWFDKTSSYMWNVTPTIGGNSSKLHYMNIHFYLSVAEDYRGDGYSFDSASGTYTLTVNTARTEKVQAAVTNAKAIVEKYASLGDAEKLRACFDEVRSLSSYNSAAAAGEVSYGDPWQMIYVFDGDPETNVVCEGYAKAFQYLFNMSTFSSAKIDSDIVTGKIASGLHMWNVVTMEDGAKYIVDATTGRFLLGGTETDAGLTESFPRAYKVTYEGKTAIYWYDSETTGQYDSTELTLSPSNYGETAEAEPTETPMATPVPETTPTVTPTEAPSETQTVTPAPTETPTPEVTETPAATTTVTPTPTEVPSETQGVTPAPTETPEVTDTPAATAVPTVAPSETSTPEVTETPTATAVPTQTPAVKAETTPAPTVPPSNAGAKTKTGTSSQETKTTKKTTKRSAIDPRILALKKNQSYRASNFIPLCARLKSASKTSITITWNRVSGAKGYVIYYTKCNTTFKAKQTKIVSGSVSSAKISGLRKGTPYKFIVVALKNKSDYTTAKSTSAQIHIWTGGSRYSNIKSISVNRSKITLKRKKTFRIKTTVKKAGRAIQYHVKTQYKSTNTAVATVSSSGKVTAKKKGKCTIYVYTQDGHYKTVKVTVR